MHIKDFFYFSKSDRAVLLVLLIVGAIATLTIYGVGERFSASRQPSSDSMSTAERWSGSGNGKKGSTPYYYMESTSKAERFPFDPNTADSTQLLRLGLQPYQVRNIYRYRAHGGVYHTPEDFARLYGLTVKQFRELRPYIRISDDYRPASEVYAPRYEKAASAPRDTQLYPVKLRPTERISLNNADTTALKRVPGIGSYFAHQIVWYRQRLGGFYDVRQLEEIDDFPKGAMAYLYVGEGEVQKFNINKLTLNQLKRHPYINYLQARAIVDYRRIKGDLASLDDLRLHKDFPPEAIDRLRPYVDYK